MAAHEIELTAPTILEGPFLEYAYKITGVDTYTFKTYSWKVIPQLFELIEVGLRVQMDATVANRYLIVYKRVPAAAAVYGNFYKSAAITANDLKYIGIGSLIAGTTGFDEYYGSAAPWVLIPDSYIYQALSSGNGSDIVWGYFCFKYINRELGLPSPYDESKGG